MNTHFTESNELARMRLQVAVNDVQMYQHLCGVVAETAKIILIFIALATAVISYGVSGDFIEQLFGAVAISAIPFAVFSLVIILCKATERRLDYKLAGLYASHAHR